LVILNSFSFWTILAFTSDSLELSTNTFYFAAAPTPISIGNGSSTLMSVFFIWICSFIGALDFLSFRTVKSFLKSTRFYTISFYYLRLCSLRMISWLYSMKSRMPFFSIYSWCNLGILRRVANFLSLFFCHKLVSTILSLIVVAISTSKVRYFFNLFISPSTKSSIYLIFAASSEAWVACKYSISYLS
jgi:hypothetical protein